MNTDEGNKDRWQCFTCKRIGIIPEKLLSVSAELSVLLDGKIYELAILNSERSSQDKSVDFFRRQTYNSKILDFK